MKLTVKALLSCAIGIGCYTCVLSPNGSFFTKPTWAHEIVLEWNRDLIPRDPRRHWSIGLKSFNFTGEDSLKCFGYKRLIYDVEQLPKYFWLGTISENVDTLINQRIYGDSLHLAEFKHLLFQDNMILIGTREGILDTVQENNYPPQVALMYFDENGDSTFFLEFEAGSYPVVKSSFINNDESIDLFVIHSLGDGPPLTMYKVGSDRESVEDREFDPEEYFGVGRFNGAKSIMKLRESGDYLLTGSFSPFRFTPGGTRLSARAGCVMRMDEEGDLLWFNSHLDSVRGPSSYIYTRSGNMEYALEHSSGFIYATGWTDTKVEPFWGIALYKYDLGGNLLRTRFYEDNYRHTGSECNFRRIVEVRPDLLAIFGRITYHPRDERDEKGLYVALIDTSGELLTDRFIHGEGIEDSRDYFLKVLQVEPNRVLALTVSNKRFLSIRFDLDPAEFVFDEARFLYPSSPSISSYPNPFNSVTHVDYELNNRMNVELSIYNSLGQKISILDQGSRNAGSYNITWDAQNNPSGVYFIRLNTPNTKRESRIMLLK